MALTHEDVRKVAQLARLELTAAEIEGQLGHLNNLLEQFEKLQTLDMSGVEPTSNAFETTNVMREDVVIESISQAEALRNAPEARGGCFVVPRIVEGATP